MAQAYTGDPDGQAQRPEAAGTPETQTPHPADIQSPDPLGDGESPPHDPCVPPEWFFKKNGRWHVHDPLVGDVAYGPATADERRAYAAQRAEEHRKAAERVRRKRKRALDLDDYKAAVLKYLRRCERPYLERIQQIENPVERSLEWALWERGRPRPPMLGDTFNGISLAVRGRAYFADADDGERWVWRAVQFLVATNEIRLVSGDPERFSQSNVYRLTEAGAQRAQPAAEQNGPAEANGAAPRLRSRHRMTFIPSYLKPIKGEIHESVSPAVLAADKSLRHARDGFVNGITYLEEWATACGDWQVAIIYEAQKAVVGAIWKAARQLTSDELATAEAELRDDQRHAITRALRWFDAGVKQRLEPDPLEAVDASKAAIVEQITRAVDDYVTALREHVARPHPRVTDSATAPPQEPAPEPPAEPTPSAQPVGPPVILGKAGEPVHVLGKKKPALTEPQYRVIKKLLDAGPDGLSKDALESDGDGGARRTLRQLGNSDPDWKRVISLPRERGRRYRIIRPPE